METCEPTVLTIDDQEDNLLTVKALLRESFPASRTLTAASGAEGIDLAAAHDPDVILLDVIMPGMDGFETLRRLKSDGRTREIPVVFLTALRGERELRVAALESGAEAFLSKPIDPIELAALVRAMTKIKTAAKLQRSEARRLAVLVDERTQEIAESRTAALNLLEDLRTENEGRRKAEAELRGVNAFLDSIIESLPSMVFLKDARELRFVRVNRAGEELLGYTRADLLGKCDHDFFPPEQADWFIAQDRLVLAQRDVVDIPEEPLLTRDRGVRIIHTRKVPILGATGEPAYLLGVAEDITERKRAEEQTAIRARQQAAIAELGQLAVAGELTALADRAVALLAEVLGVELCKILEVMPGGSTALLRAGVGWHDGLVGQATVSLGLDSQAGYTLGSREPVVVADLRSETRFSGPALLHDHHVQSGLSVVIGAPERPYGVLGVHTTRRRAFDQQDVHFVQAAAHLLGNAVERREAEAERGRLLAAIEQSADVVYITALDGSIQYVNPAFTTVTGYTREEAVGQNPRLLKSGRHDAAFYASLWQTLTGGAPWRGRMVNRRKDGALFTADATLSPVCDSRGRIVSFVAVNRDVSERLRLEEQLQASQKMEAVGSLAGGIAHDFNNLLAVILSYTGFAMDELHEGDPLVECLSEIKKASERAAALTRQLLAFSRKQLLDPQVLALNQIVGNLEKMLHRLIGEDIELQQALAPDLGRIKADSGQLEQVVMNLVVNARDAMPGGGKLVIATANVELDEAYAAGHVGVTPGPHVLLSVRDTGCGMDAATLQRVFEPFFTTKEKGKGTGLGLSTVYGIVRQSGGTIEVDSEPGRGSTFKVFLPRTLTAAAPETPRPATAQARGTETVLVVEDEEGVRKVAARMLRKIGYEVLVAANAGEALLACERHVGVIHLLLTDVVMPTMSGPQLAERVQRLRPGLRVLYMSGYTDDAMLRHGVQEQGTKLIAKPFSAPALAARVRETLDDVGH